jgi:MerT mercuric transport protein
MTGPRIALSSDAESGVPVATRRVVGASAAAGALSAVVAAVAGLCCVGPAVIAVLGVGGVVAAAGLKPYRAPLLALSFVLLAAAFWRTYRPRVAATGVSCRIAVGRATWIGLWVAAVVWWTALVLYFVS